MQPVIPYQLIAKLGACQIGGVWSAVDEQERSLVVAVLDAGVAGESRWRDAFAATTNAIAQSASAGPAYVAADFSADTPWVAYPKERLPTAERTFLALGMTYEPVPAHAAEPAPAGRHLHPDAGPTPAPTNRPVTAVEQPPPTGQTGQPPQTVASPPPGSPPRSPAAELPPSLPRPRVGRWPSLAIGLVLGLLAGGGLVTLVDPGTDPPRPPSTASGSPLPAPAPAAAPLSPGLEPPADGRWPAGWVRFTPADRIRTVTGLDGLSFPVRLPPQWQCTPVERAEGLSRHRCGGPAGGGGELGGELVVRECPTPCDGPRQTALRTAEEAWGLQWIRCGLSCAYAETSSLTVDGARRYGLVVVAYWRSGEGDIDQQLVLRMTAPVTNANLLRRVANYLRDVLVF
ncbi:hypothetical protein ACIG87_29190 [Micromonospora sp. NPDC051925]|uniref:hypothetical protein n=1 Tax=Micromonospora sp. NPDC051925 TaxID=3364288 RepID=UPI0037C98C37